MKMKILRILPCIAAGILLSNQSAHASPYAAGVTVSGTTVTWHLNESVTNGVVAYLFNVSGGTYVASNYVGGTVASPVNAGPQTFSLSTYTNFQIYIFNIGTGSPHQISPNGAYPDPSHPLLDINGPRGVAVNRNANSTNFGRIYMTSASPGTDSVRTVGKGLYALNADFTDAFGYGNTVMPTVGTGPGQIQWGSSTTYGVWKVFVGPDDMVYVGDASGASTAGTSVGGGVWMVQPDLSSAQDLFPFNGGVGASQLVCEAGTPVVTGSYAAGTLTLYSEEWNRSGSDAMGHPSGGFQTVWQYPFYTNNPTLGSNQPLTLPWNLSNLPFDLPSAGSCISTYGYSGNGNPNLCVSSGIGSVDEVVCDFYIAPDGKFFCSEERSANTGTQGLWVYDSIANGNCLLWDDLDVNGGVSPFATAYSVAVSPDDNYMAMGCSSASGNTANDGQILICSLDSQPAATGVNVSGLPDLTTISLINYGPNGGDESLRSTAWDAADNVYCVSGSDDSMRAFTLGLTTTCITSGDKTGTNGAFSFSYPSVQVSVGADETLISEPNPYGNPTNGTFTLTRTGSTASTLTVFYSLGGTATNGSTYTVSPTAGSVTFPAGSSTVQVTIAVKTNIVDAATLTVVLTLDGSSDYSPAPPNSATMAIANTGPQELSVTGLAIPSMYRGISNDYASFVITRYGDTNAPAYTIPANDFVYTGTATLGVDYTGAVAGTITVNPGDQTETVQISDPIATGVYHGNETIVVTMNTNVGAPIISGTTEVPVVAGSATLTLVDNADPPAIVLWSDPLTNPATSVNWTLTFANSNLGPTTVPPIVIPNYPNYTASNPDPNQFPNGTGLDDFDVEFGYDVTNDNVGYSPAMLLNGYTNALKVTVNKIMNYVPEGTTGGGASAGVNLYPTGMKFSGSFAFRFSMALSEGTLYTTEFNSFGINHFGTNCNWFASDVYAGSSGTTNCDGLWFWVDSDVDGWAGVNSYTMVGGSPLPNTGWTSIENAGGVVAPYINWFKHPTPYNGYPSGVPNVGNGSTAYTWADVEVKQVNKVVTMSINKFPVLVYTNSTNFAKSGDVMLGYDDPFASVGNVAGNGVSGAAVYYSNARVVQLTPPVITSTTLSGTNLTIVFTDSDTDDTAASFELLGSTALTAAFTKVTATFSQSPATGAWQAVVAIPSGTTHIFYEVVRIN
jgi:hypothetical protein